MSSAKFLLNGLMILGLLIPHVTRSLPVNKINSNQTKTIFCIQIAASKTYESPSNFKLQFNLADEVLYFEKDGWYKYVIGPYPSSDSAQSRLYTIGIEGFVTSVDSSALKHEGDPKAKTIGEIELMINGKKELYEGEYITGPNGNILRDGDGKSTIRDGGYSDGTKYFGKYRADKRNGFGTTYAKNGSIEQEGEWLDDSFRKGSKYNENGARFVGEFKNNELSGQGSVFINGKLAFSGIWKDGKIEGEGIAYYPSGVIAYKGEFTNLLMDGHGTSYKPDGTVDFQGEWKKNSPVILPLRIPGQQPV